MSKWLNFNSIISQKCMVMNSMYMDDVEEGCYLLDCPEGTQMKIGNSFILKIDPKKLYIFHAETEENFN